MYDVFHVFVVCHWQEFLLWLSVQAFTVPLPLSLSPDSRPTLHQLTKMTTPSGKTVEIIKYIAADWHDRVGIHLNFDPTGRTLALIRARHPSDPEACCTDMMKEWLEGRGRRPVNWATLVRVLKDGEFSVLAEDVEQLLVTGGEF